MKGLQQTLYCITMSLCITCIWTCGHLRILAQHFKSCEYWRGGWGDFVLQHLCITGASSANSALFLRSHFAISSVVMFFFSAGGNMPGKSWQLTGREPRTIRKRLQTRLFFYLFLCCWILFLMDAWPVQAGGALVESWVLSWGMRLMEYSNYHSASWISNCTIFLHLQLWLHQASWFSANGKLSWPTLRSLPSWSEPGPFGVALSANLIRRIAMKLVQLRMRWPRTDRPLGFCLDNSQSVEFELTNTVLYNLFDCPWCDLKSGCRGSISLSLPSA